MRIIEQKAAAAFFAGRDFSLSNTSVVVSGGMVRFYLHGNLIARRPESDRLAVEYSAGGYHSRTTASRLRSLGAAVHIKNGRICLADGREIRFSFNPSRAGYGC